eukprot:TRINITY_DN38697_c0_g1_i1.p1 TRINITY_DN38697_c0_g1~~TRINITY_DN38697_c0_g1_i1.p1  ORF type:complete len:347 (+),score=87.00 TRINITY_DN38697_c0_g1_i1:221-1261(+)
MAAAGPRAPQPQARTWDALQQFPAATQQSLFQIFNDLRNNPEANGGPVTEITILLLGKQGVGKSSTVNSVLNERVCAVNTFQAQGVEPEAVARVRSGFLITLIDTPGLLDGGGVSSATVERIKSFCAGKTIDVMMYVDRLDSYRVDSLDREVIREITEAFTSKIWKRSVLVLTHGQMQATPDESSYANYVGQRKAALEKVIRKEGRLGGRELPLVLVENTGRCRTNEGGEKILPNEQVFVVELVRVVARIALESARSGGGLELTQALLEGPDPNKRSKWFIPLAIALQVLVGLQLKKLIDSDVEAEQERRPEYELKADDYIRNGALKESLRRQDLMRKKSLGSSSK